MLFQVENRVENRQTHCGVLEFIADEGMVYLPYWMMKNLLLQEGDVLTLRAATLPKGTFVKLQPHSKDFLDISNPRAVLETTLRNFSCLTVGDTIPISYNNKQYWIDIVEANPANAISVIETDCNVDFAPPLDYVEPEKVFPKAAAAASAAAAPVAMLTTGSAAAAADGGGASGSGRGGEVEKVEEPQFLAFAGTGRRLDGRAAAESHPVAIPLAHVRPTDVSLLAGVDAAAGGGGADGSAPKAGSAGGTRKAGKLMFKDRLAAKFGDGKSANGGAGGGGGATAAAPANVVKEEDKGKEPEFKAFQGTSYKLK